MISIKDFLAAKHSPDRFVELKDGWIADRLLRLDFSPASLEKEERWQEAEMYAAGYGRQLSDYEAETLIDRRECHPSMIKAAAILGLKPLFKYWTQVREAGGGIQYYLCYLPESGVIMASHRLDRHIVRPVRRSVLEAQ